MDSTIAESYTVFEGPRRLAHGSLAEAGLAAKQAFEGGATEPVLIFDDRTGRSRDIDMSGSPAQVMARLAPAPARTRGRPRLGVVAREVTLLPRHWDWLADQPGGASVALRKLVDQARRSHADQDERRQGQERAYHFMSALAGDWPGFEEATRALFAHDAPRFAELIRPWPADVREYASRLAGF